MDAFASNRFKVGPQWQLIKIETQAPRDYTPGGSELQLYFGGSQQEVDLGPVYIFKNVFLNIAASAYKLNNDPSGFYIFHNTSARTLGPGNWGAYAFTSLGYTQSDGDPGSR